jgi:Fe-S-cluster-containing hydrogenase component 2
MKLPRRSAGATRLLPDIGSPTALVLNGIDVPGTFVTGNGDEMASTCLRCPEQPCGRFAEGELPLTSLTSPVCPVDAISFDEAGVPVMGTWCVGCGLCVMRCPFGSLHLTGAVAAVGDTDLSRFIETDAASLAAFAGGLEYRNELSARESAATVRLLAGNAQLLQQDAFYPLVARLLTAAGFPTVVTRQGDTSNRIDAITRLPNDTLPIEIKSPTESMVVNIKSVQQALENKVVLDARNIGPTDPTSSTLVVAFEQAPPRSDVTELVDDVYATYGISVGLLDLGNLYELVWRALVVGDPAPPETLSRLRGPM